MIRYWFIWCCKIKNYMNTFCNTRIEETKTERKQTCTWLFLGKNKIPLTKHYFGRNTDKFIVTEYDKKKNFIDPRRKMEEKGTHAMTGESSTHGAS